MPGLRDLIPNCVYSDRGDTTSRHMGAQLASEKVSKIKLFDELPGTSGTPGEPRQDFLQNLAR